MTAANQYLPFANGGGANALTAGQWAALGSLLASGFQSGTALSVQANALFRQLSVPNAGLAQFIADNQTADVLDDGVPANYEAKFGTALKNFVGQYVQSGKPFFGTATGTDTYATTLTPAPGATFLGTSALTTDMEILVFFGNANATTSPSLNVNALGATLIKKMGGGSPAAGDITGFVPLIFNGTNWVINGFVTSDIVAIIATQSHVRLTANLTIFINGATGVDAAGGGTSGAPFRTLQYASDYVQNSFDLAGFNVVFQCIGGFSAGLTLSGPYTGSKGASSVTFNWASAGSVAATNSCCFNVSSGGAITVSGAVTLVATGSGAAQGTALLCNNSYINFGNGVIFQNCAVSHITCQTFGSILCIGNYFIIGGAPVHVNGAAVSLISIANVTVTITGTPAFTTAYISLTQSYAGLNGCTFVGSATGTRYFIQAASYVFTGAAGATYLPGNAAGTAVVPSVYN